MPALRPLALLPLLLALGCGDKASDTAADGADGGSGGSGGDDSGTASDDTGGFDPPAAGPLEFTTTDGVVLVGDWLPAAAPGRPAVVLLHMIPPSWDRSSWPGDFVDLLHAHDWSVVVLDRRGAGDSGGTARDAYEGEGGRLDVGAVTAFLQDTMQVGPLAVVGASNGTTSAIDYAVWAGGEGLPVPAALGLMTGDTYTENQTAMSAYAALGLPTAFTFSTEERAWSVAQQPLDPGGWSFLEYASGDHGTLMFSAAPEVADDLDAFLVGTLEAR